MYKLRRKLLSQNFLHNRRLVDSLLRQSSIGKNDTILEIGCGKGILTEQLIEKAKQVIGLEIDPHWYAFLQSKFHGISNLTLHPEDVFNFHLPVCPYKVFSNIPFNIEGRIVRYLIDAPNPPQDCYLVVMRELAERLSGEHKENLFSLSHKPWFEFSIVHYFKRSDFTPFPKVDSVLWRFTERSSPLLPFNKKGGYERFVIQIFKEGLSLFHNLKDGYREDKLLKSFNCININKKTKPGQLTPDKLLHLYIKLEG
ncbi:MAG: rRNA adenine N(6)-methyltransferase family protein [bacterium]|nr:rRNA adenine N(6)-methyltransferase family protein [bacterium]